MPRHANLGNGSFLVTLDKHARMRDIYYPYVGMEDHTAYKHAHRIGVFDQDRKQFSWIDEDKWQARMEYEGTSLVCISEVKNEEFGLTIRFRDGVDVQQNIFIRSITLINHWENDRTISLFFNHDFHLYGYKLKDTALYAPDVKNPKKNGAVIHYRQCRYFLINGYTNQNGIDQFTVGKSEYQGLEGTWRDAEDGILSGHAIEQGSVDSTIGFKHHLPAKKTSKQYYWLCAGKSNDDIEKLNRFVIKNHPEHLLNITARYWKRWIHQKEIGCVSINEEIMNIMHQSLLIIRTQINNNGAIIAANDSDIMAFNKDTYTYMWPRDGALIAYALDSAGHIEVTRHFRRDCICAAYTLPC